MRFTMILVVFAGVVMAAPLAAPGAEPDANAALTQDGVIEPKACCL